MDEDLGSEVSSQAGARDSAGRDVPQQWSGEPALPTGPPPYSARSAPGFPPYGAQPAPGPSTPPYGAQPAPGPSTPPYGAQPPAGLPPAGGHPFYGAPPAQGAGAGYGAPAGDPRPYGATAPWWPAPPGDPRSGPQAPPGWPAWSPGAAAGGSGGSQPPRPPLYGQTRRYGGSDPYGWAAYGSDAVHVGTSRRSRLGMGAVATLVGVALLAGGLGAGLGVAFTGKSPTSAAGASGLGNGSSTGNGIAGGSSGTSGPPGSTLPSTSRHSSLVRDIANAVDPAVVDINVVDASAGPAAGTGMIMTSSGYVLTNNHVIDSATTVQVTVQGHAGSYPAHVIGYDAGDDVAVVKIDGVSGLPTVSFGNSSSVSVGDTVVAIGNALGQGGSPTVVSGSVTATGRSISAGDAVTGVPESLHNLLQTDAEIQPGDSGGPLVNAKGQVIGMDTAAASAESGSTLGFAIPIDQARAIAAQIMSHKSGNGVVVGLSAFLGINVAPASSANPNGGFGFPGFGASGTSGSSGSALSGVTISSVVQGSPAAFAGLQGGDVITAVDGKATPSFTDLHADIQQHKPGQSLTITYADPTGASHTVRVRLAGIPY